MTDIARMNQAKEAITKRHTFELRKMGDEVESEMKTTQAKNDKDLSRMKKDYEVKMEKEKIEAELKLSKVRNQFNSKIEDENKRYEKLLIRIQFLLIR